MSQTNQEDVPSSSSLPETPPPAFATPSPALNPSPSSPSPSPLLPIIIKWSTREIPLLVSSLDSVLDLKRQICEQTGVLPKRQKLTNVRKGNNRPAEDATLLSEVKLKANMKILMMGTVEEEIITEADFAEASSAESDSFLDDSLEEQQVLSIAERDENIKKLKRRCEMFKFKMLSPPFLAASPPPPNAPPSSLRRPLLVLDIDYTIFDHRSTAEDPRELMRPFLHEFLAQVYEYYDLIIWSATSMRWIEVKMRELGLSSSPLFRFVCFLDHLAMITVLGDKAGREGSGRKGEKGGDDEQHVFDCKPLAVIWNKFPEYYGRHNTIMFDDLRRNFVMNPKNGLVIKPFSKAHFNRDKDRELPALAQYLLYLHDNVQDFTKINHAKWRNFI